MSDERRRVLDMLAEEKITVDEAERLLKALKGGSYVEDRVQDAVEGGLKSLDRLGETLAEEIEHGIRKQITVVVDEEDQASVHDDAFEVGDSPRLDVRSFNGPVRVSAGEPGSIRVQAKLKDPQAAKYSAVQLGDTIKVDATLRGRTGGFLSGLFGQQSGADIEVTVPAATSVGLFTSNGPIVLRGTASGGTLETSNSRHTGRRVQGRIEGTDQQWANSHPGTRGLGAAHYLKRTGFYPRWARPVRRDDFQWKDRTPGQYGPRRAQQSDHFERPHRCDARR